MIRLLGFKDASAVAWEYSIGKPYFLYPSEAEYIGSTRAFTALYKSLVAKHKVALVWAVFRKSSAPRLGALVPFAPPGNTDDDNSAYNQLFDPEMVTARYAAKLRAGASEARAPAADPHDLFPMGLHFVPLAFADDLRARPAASARSAVAPGAPPPFVHPDVVAAMKEVVARLPMSIGFNPRRYRNPQLERFYAVMEKAVFADELEGENEDGGDSEAWPDLLAGISDQTLPKYNSIRKRATAAISNWNALVRGAAAVAPAPAPAPPTSKRTAAAAGLDDDKDAVIGDPAGVRRKNAVTNPALGRAHPLFAQLHAEMARPLRARFADVSVEQLQEFAVAAAIRTRARARAGLIDAVSRYFTENHMEK